MSVPARLVYEDSNNTTQVIGRYNPQGVDEGRISTFTIDENAKAYTKVIIEGDPSLQKRMPVKNSEFGTKEREIIVEVDENKNGNFERRQRVFPQTAGNTNDDGRYKNKRLYGFKKSVGEDDVTISSTSTNIEEVLKKALPSNYSVSYPSGETPPSVENFTFNGSRQQLFSDLRKEFNHFVIFTGKLDGNGNDEVLLQPQGFGGVQFDLVRGEDPFIYDYFKPRDTSNVVSKVQVVGTTPKGLQINETFEANEKPLDKLPEPDATRFIRHKTDTLGGTLSQAKSQAEEIARSIIDPTATTNLAVDTSLRTSSNLNQSVGIIDDSRNIDENNTLDDVFTVVKQKDYLHDGLTYLSFEFESESTQSQREKWRDHDSEQANLYPSKKKDVGSQNIDEKETNNNSISVKKKTGASAEGVGNPTDKELRRNQDTDIDNYTVDEKVTVTDSFGDTRNVSASGWEYMGAVSPDSSKPVQIGYFSLTGTNNTNLDLDILVTNGDEDTIIHHQGLVQPFENNADNALSGFIGSNFATIQWRDATDEYGTYKVYVASKGSNTGNISYSISTVDLTHNHDDDIEIEDADGTQKPEMVKTTNPEANITSDAVYEEDGTHFHVIDVTTEEELVDFFEQNKTDK